MAFCSPTPLETSGYRSLLFLCCCSAAMLSIQCFYKSSQDNLRHCQIMDKVAQMTYVEVIQIVAMREKKNHHLSFCTESSLQYHYHILSISISMNYFSTVKKNAVQTTITFVKYLINPCRYIRYRTSSYGKSASLAVLLMRTFRWRFPYHQSNMVTLQLCACAVSPYLSNMWGNIQIWWSFVGGLQPCLLQNTLY